MKRRRTKAEIDAAYLQRLKQRAAEAVGTCCAKCGTDRRLEFAHREPTDLSGNGRGARWRYLDAIRHPERYIRLCRTHHRAYDGPSYRSKSYRRPGAGEVAA